MCSWQLADYARIPEMSCVYVIKHSVSGREYIGRSVNLKDRARKHWQELMSGKHKNPKFIKTLAKHGDSFVIAPLVIGDTDYCRYIEGKLLEGINLKESLNCHRNSDGGWLGLKFSDEARRRLSDMRKGKPFTDAMRAAQAESRKHSLKWKMHQAWMRSPEAIAQRTEKAATPEVRAKAVATRKANGHEPQWEVARQQQIELARQNLFAALDWAVAQGASRDAALKKFGSSWGSLKKFQPEWEAINGPLSLPKRASGEHSGNYKHGLSAERRRKKTPDELLEIRRQQSEKMSGVNNPMFGRTHSVEARRVQAEAARKQAADRKAKASLEKEQP